MGLGVVPGAQVGQREAEGLEQLAGLRVRGGGTPALPPGLLGGVLLLEEDEPLDVVGRDLEFLTPRLHGRDVRPVPVGVGPAAADPDVDVLHMLGEPGAHHGVEDGGDVGLPVGLGEEVEVLGAEGRAEVLEAADPALALLPDVLEGRGPALLEGDAGDVGELLLKPGLRHDALHPGGAVADPSVSPHHRGDEGVPLHGAVLGGHLRGVAGDDGAGQRLALEAGGQVGHVGRPVIEGPTRGLVGGPAGGSPRIE